MVARRRCGEAGELLPERSDLVVRVVLVEIHHPVPALAQDGQDFGVAAPGNVHQAVLEALEPVRVIDDERPDSRLRERRGQPRPDRADVADRLIRRPEHRLLAARPALGLRRVEDAVG
jgi:hypothetical protein